MLDHTMLSVAAFGGGHDRAEVFASDEKTVIAIADGAGGSTGASRAAELVMDIVREVVTRRTQGIGPFGLCQLLAQLDRLVLSCRQAGETTAVLIEVTNDTFWGASVGDSGAWLVHAGQYIDLTARQHRKWRLGTGYARPVGFGPLPLCGTILAATDGLFECAPPDRIADAVGDHPLCDAAESLLDGVRLPGGALRDDVALVLCRPARFALAATG